MSQFTCSEAPGAIRRASSDRSEVDFEVRAAAESKSWAWDALVERYGALVRGVARRHGLGPHDVDDVAQMTWLRLIEHIDELRNPDAIAGWLATTARRESLLVLRRTDRECPVEELVAVVVVEPVNEARLVAAERTTALRAGVSELRGRQRELMTMMLCEPPPDYADIARTLSIPQGSIGPTRQRGLERLRADRTLVALCAD